MKTNSKTSPLKAAKRKLSPSGVRREKWKNRAIDLYLKGVSQRVVRDQLSEETNHSFSIGTINKFIQEGVKEWQTSKNDMVAAHKEIELEKINRLEIEYWDAWERSKKNQKATTETKTKGKTGEASDKLTTTSKRTDDKQSNGDPRFLEGIHRCVETRNKLLGIEVPQIQITNTNTNTNTSSSTTVVRSIVFRTRKTTSEQILDEQEE